MTSKVLAVIEPLLVSMGTEPDPTCWVVWGDDPGIRYVVFVPTDPGLLQIHVRVNVPQEGPRSSSKLIRWNRVQVGELNMEVVAGHRLLSFQVEGQVMKGSDEDADAIAAFALELLDAIDGRRGATRGAATASETGEGQGASSGPIPARPPEPPMLPPPAEA